jgi:hypothetical protein
MTIQPPDSGSHMPRQMVSRVEGVGSRHPTPYDKALCAKARGEALKLQREALKKSIAKTEPARSVREKTS